MGEESDHVHITALSDALGVPIRVVYLDRSSCDSGGASVNHHDFIPTPGDCPNATSGSTETTIPFITLLYRPGHYDILYPKWCTCWLSKSFFFWITKASLIGTTCNLPKPLSWGMPNELLGWLALENVFHSSLGLGSSAFSFSVKKQDNCIYPGRNNGDTLEISGLDVHKDKGN